jgi:hypothetical protein
MAANVKSYNTSGATNAVHTGPVKLVGYTMANATANAATIAVYNALTVTGSPVLIDTVAGNTSKILILDAPIYLATGATVNITGTGPNAVGSVVLE